MLADFLSHNSCDTLYLVGDIVDGWQLKRWYWSEAQERCVAEVLRSEAGPTAAPLPSSRRLRRSKRTD